MRDGRPLRFLGVALAGWTALRTVMLWPGAEPLAPLMRALAPPLAAAVPLPLIHSSPVVLRPVGVERQPPAVVGNPRPLAPTAAVTVTLAPMMTAARPPPSSPISMPGVLFAPLAPAQIARAGSRLAGSAWMLARGGPAGTLSGGQLGASQAGVRMTYALGGARRVALTARYATPLQGVGKEVAVGVEWKPTRLPFRLIAEQRFVLDGGRGGPTLGIIAGYGPADIAPGVRIESYGQAGAIARDGMEGFVDTAARLTHPTARIGGARLDLGVGAWGSAQRGAARFDLGPTAGIAIPVAGRHVRMSLDWRERLAGSARPGSGPALTIGSDF